MAPQWKHPCLSPFLGDGLRDCALYLYTSEESEGEENNREVEDDPRDSSSPEGRVKSEGASRGYEFSSEEY
jgi:hypothetical protein